MQGKKNNTRTNWLREKVGRLIKFEATLKAQMESEI